MKRIQSFEQKIIIFGVAGFIGHALVKKLIENNFFVIGIDNTYDYYDINLKQTRLNELKNCEAFTFIEADIAAKDKVMDIFKKYEIMLVVMFDYHAELSLSPH